MKILDERTKALVQLGYFQVVDLAFAGAIAMDVLTLFYWWLFGNPQPWNFVIMFLTAVIILCLWMVMILFRCCWFVLQLTAEIKSMPAQAAKLAIAFSSGATEGKK